MKIFVDGKYFDERKAKISVFDHGLLYGDGVFEGIRAYNGRVFKLKEHIDRLFASAKSILLAIPMSHAYGLGHLLVPALIHGSALLLRDAFVPHRLPGDVRRVGARVYPGVPFMFDHFAENPPVGGWPPTLTHLITAGAPIGKDLHLWMGDSRGHYEGDTLVIESQNFTDRTAVGGTQHSEKLRMVERFTRIDPEMIDYEVHIDDPATFTKPWTFRMTITSQPGYEIYEYGCHEGNNAMRNALAAERAYEKAAEEARAKGLPPPERVFERVNGDDRAR